MFIFWFSCICRSHSKRNILYSSSKISHFYFYILAEKIEVSEEEYEEELKTMADVYQMEVEKIKEMLPEKSAQQIKQDIAVRKAAEFAVEHAKEK